MVKLSSNSAYLLIHWSSDASKLGDGIMGRVVILVVINQDVDETLGDQT